MLGVVTGTFGGVIGDVICNRVPSLFRPAPLYATCAFAGAAVYLAAVAAGVRGDAAQPAAVAVAVFLRLVAVRRQWVMRPVGGEASAPPDAPAADLPPARKPKRRGRRSRLTRARKF